MSEDSKSSRGDSELAALLPQTVFRAPFVRKDLGPLRYLSVGETGVVAHFDGGISLHVTGTPQALVQALLDVMMPRGGEGV